MVHAFNSVRRIVHGFGSIQSVGEEAKRLGAGKVLVVTDPGVQKAGILDILARALENAGLKTDFFTGVEPDPKIEVVDLSLAAAREAKPDVIIGMGGGSSLDIAKATSVLMTNEGPIDKYFGMELVPKPGLPLLLIPTTAGTGSEMTSISVLSDTLNDVKKGIVSEHMFAKVVLLDPELTIGLPPALTATTGMDALVHAIESFTGVRATPFTDLLNRESIALVAANLRKAFANGSNRAARENMLYASCLSGMAFSNTQNGLIHAIALAIGGKFHLPHGLLTAFICPWVMEFNLLATPAKFIEIARLFGESVQGLPEIQAARLSVKAVKSLLDDLRIPYTLKSYGVPREAIENIAKATLGAARLIGNNPRAVTEKEVVELLKANYGD
ncbi:MAG: iron-containing alcohol dehydrogenase [Desulfovibrio sp.]|nr:iron-containing alcohol dehydrogenase [Desulfovibrio sp.]MBI4960294.1 iron-containing alcohol dehydrogenase [Desulfovibrio sp.]